MEMDIGDLVCSDAGRDAKKKFIVIGKEDDDYVLLSDGKVRRIEKPKKKKIKHIRSMNINIKKVAEAIKQGKKISNADIRKAIAEVAED